MGRLPDEYFSDYEAYTEDEIAEITSKGILLKNGMFIDFSVCAENFKETNHQSSGKCVGERDISFWSFTFYPTRNKLIEFFSPNNTLKRFHSLQNKVIYFGYTTYDLT